MRFYLKRSMEAQSAYLQRSCWFILPPLLVIQMPLLPQGFQELFLAPNGNVLLNDRVHE